MSYFRRRMAVQITLWVVLAIVIGAIMFLGCSSPPEPEQPHIPLTDQEIETYSEINWTDPKQRLSVAVEALRQAEAQIARLEQIQHRYPTTERTKNLAEFHKIRVQLLFQITTEAQNVQWNVE